MQNKRGLGIKESDVFSIRLFYPEASCVIIWLCNREIKKQKPPRPKFDFCFHPNIAYATFMHTYDNN